MSELTQCNYCSLQEIQRRAKREGKFVTRRADTKYALGGFNVYVYPRGVPIDHDKHFVAWFMELTDHCVCAEEEKG